MTTVDSNARNRILTFGGVAFPDGFREPMHSHADHGQLKWPSSGVARVRTPPGIFVASRRHAVWIPAGEAHGGNYSGEVLEKSVYVRREHCAGLPACCSLVEVPPRLRDTIERAVNQHSTYDMPDCAEDAATLKVLEDEALDTGRQPLALALCEGSRIQPVLDKLIATPADPRLLAEWARELRMSERSLVRAFQEETGVSFGDYRRRARALHALTRLATGADIGTIVGELGYESKSAFVHMFRTVLGVTPARYYRAAEPARAGATLSGEP